MAKNNDNRNRFLSALITLLLGAGILALLFFTSLHYEYPPKDAKLQDLLQDTIIFGGELVELGDLPELDNSQDLAANGEEMSQTNEADVEQTQDAGQDDLQDQGIINEPPKPQVATSQQESPMKVKEQPPKKPQAEKKTVEQPQQPVKPQSKATAQPQPARDRQGWRAWWSRHWRHRGSTGSGWTGRLHAGVFPSCQVSQRRNSENSCHSESHGKCEECINSGWYSHRLAHSRHLSGACTAIAVPCAQRAKHRTHRNANLHYQVIHNSP